MASEQERRRRRETLRNVFMGSTGEESLFRLAIRVKAPRGPTAR
jgi:hypothetical protein